MFLKSFYSWPNASLWLQLATAVKYQSWFHDTSFSQPISIVNITFGVTWSGTAKLIFLQYLPESFSILHELLAMVNKLCKIESHDHHVFYSSQKMYKSYFPFKQHWETKITLLAMNWSLSFFQLTSRSLYLRGFYILASWKTHPDFYLELALVPALRAGHITVWEPTACTFKLYVTYLLKCDRICEKGSSTHIQFHELRGL